MLYEDGTELTELTGLQCSCMERTMGTFDPLKFHLFQNLSIKNCINPAKYLSE